MGINTVYANHNICNICGIENDLLKYKRIDFYIIYDENKQSEITTFFTNVNLESKKYNLKEETKPTIKITTHSKTGKSQYMFSGSLTFESDGDNDSFKNIIFPLIDGKDIVYAKIYELDNTHHYKNPQPDIILNEIILGDPNEVIIND